MIDMDSSGPAMHGKAPSLLDLGMRLHVPYNNDFGLIEKLIPYAPYIRSIYLPCNHNVLGSGRNEGRATNRNWDSYDAEVKDIAKIVAPHGIKVNMLLNSLHVSADILNNFQSSALYRYLKKYEFSDVEWLTVANIQLAMLLRRHFPRFKLDVSVLALIDSVKRAQYWYDLVRPDLFCLDLDRSKDLHLIENITLRTGVPVKVLVMDFCLPDCPYKPWHYIHNALKEENPFSCWQLRADKPWYYYKGRSIPPYYLGRYAGLIHDIKIVERNSDSETILRNVLHYAKQSDSRYMLPDGGIVQAGVMPPAISPSVDKLYYNLNSKHPLFKPLPDNVFDQTLGCDLNCGNCTFCYDVWKDEWQVRENYELLAGYVREMFTDPASQRYYLGLLDNLHGQRHNVAFIAAIRAMEEYVEEPFRTVLDYFLGLALIELKSPLADVYIKRLNVPELCEHLRQMQVVCRGQEVITYTDFDPYDTNSFVYLQRLVLDASSDSSARYNLIETYLRMREEKSAQELLESVELDEEMLKRFCLAAFDSSCYDIVILLTEHLENVAGLSAPLCARLSVVRQFSRLMKGLAQEEGALSFLGTSSSYSQKENFAHLFLNNMCNGVRPNRHELEVLAVYCVTLQTEKYRAFAKMIYDFYLTLFPDQLNVLTKFQELLFDMNKRTEADEVSNVIDRLNLKNRGELDRLSDVKSSLNGQTYMTNTQAAQQEQFLFVDAPPLVRKKETDRFRGHPVSKRMLELIDTLGGSYRIERSFKFIRNHLLCNRFIVTVPLWEGNVCHNQAVSMICRELAMPESYYNYFVQQILVAKKVHFGFEENGKDSVLKVYLEFPYDHSQQLQAVSLSDPWLLLLGFKWDPHAPGARRVISRYSGLPSYTPQQVHALVTERFPHTQGGIILPLVTSILKMYDNSAPNLPMWYLDVTEEGTPRQSFDVKTYRARLQISHILPMLRDLCRHYNIPAHQAESYFNTIKGHKFGHLSCGIGRDGEEYIAIYHEVFGQSESSLL